MSNIIRREESVDAKRCYTRPWCDAVKREKEKKDVERNQQSRV